MTEITLVIVAIVVIGLVWKFRHRFKYRSIVDQIDKSPYMPQPKDSTNVIGARNERN